jgi:hypothetical protein
MMVGYEFSQIALFSQQQNGLEYKRLTDNFRFIGLFLIINAVSVAHFAPADPDFSRMRMISEFAMFALQL